MSHSGIGQDLWSKEKECGQEEQRATKQPPRPAAARVIICNETRSGDARAGDSQHGTVSHYTAGVQSWLYHACMNHAMHEA